MRTPIVILVAVTLTACTPRVSDPDWQTRPVWGLKPVREADLRRLLSGVEVGPHCCKAAEDYYADGRYRHVGYDVTHYLVSGNVVSVLALSGQPVEAHRFYTDETGKVFYTTRGRDGALPANPRPIGAQP